MSATTRDAVKDVAGKVGGGLAGIGAGMTGIGVILTPVAQQAGSDIARSIADRVLPRQEHIGDKAKKFVKKLGSR